MRKYLLLCIAFFTFCIMSMPQVSASRTSKHVYDESGLFSDQEAAELEDLAQEMSDDRQADIIILISSQGLKYDSFEDYVDVFYENNGFGYDQAGGDGIVFAIDVISRSYYFCTNGSCMDFFTDSRLDDLEDAVMDDLKNGNWYDAGVSFINAMKKYRDPELPYTLQERLSIGLERIGLYAGAGVGISGIITAIKVRRRKAKVTVNRGTYLRKGSLHMLQQDDFMTGEVTTRVRINQGGGGRPGGGRPGGHSSGGGIHISSGGGMHGGRGGHF